MLNQEGPDHRELAEVPGILPNEEQSNSGSGWSRALANPLGGISLGIT